GYTLFNPVIGGQLRSETPIQVVSGRIDKPVVHFEAPGRPCLDAELSTFIQWFNDSKTDTSLDPLLRAAITHLWFVTLHPLDDG
ncbi:cell filamentation protein Fic, partial [Vibrio vulnificus]